MDTPAGQSGKRGRTFRRTPGEGRQSAGPQSPEAKRRSQNGGSGKAGALGGRGNRRERLKKEEVGWRRAKMRERERDRQWTHGGQHRPRDREAHERRDRKLCGATDGGTVKQQPQKEASASRKKRGKGRTVGNQGLARWGCRRGTEALGNHFFKAHPNSFSCHSRAAALLTSLFSGFVCEGSGRRAEVSLSPVRPGCVISMRWIFLDKWR